MNTSELYWNERINMKYAQIGPFENFNPRNNVHVELVQQEAKHILGQITEANGGEEQLITPAPRTPTNSGPDGNDIPETPRRFGPYGDDAPETPTRFSSI